MDNQVSLRDIARLCGVSVSTVSKALNEKSDVGSEKRKEIQRIAKELNYIPNYMASVLRTRRTKNIGVLLSEETGTNLMHEHFTRILNSFKDTVEARAYYLTFLNASASLKRLSFLEQCKYLNFDGVLILCADYKVPEVKELIDSPIPCVAVDHISEKHICIMGNYYGDMGRLLRLIYGRGHRKVAYMHSLLDEGTLKRVKAYKDFMKGQGLGIPDNYLLTCPYRDYEKASALTKIILGYPNRPTCIVYPDDLTAVAGLNTLQELGIKVPQDMSIAGYDGLNLVNIVRPRITTIQQDTISMGIQAGNRLLNRIAVPLAENKSETIVVTGMLEPGESVSVVGVSR